MNTERFDVAASANAINSAQILYIAASRFGKQWRSTMHSHNCAELFYCVRGAGSFISDGVRHSVGSDDLILVNAGVEHTEDSQDEAPLEYIVIGIDELEFVFTPAERQYLIVNCGSTEDHDFLFYMRNLLHESETEMLYDKDIAAHLLQLLLLRLLRNAYPNLAMACGKRGNKECARARRYIDEHFAQSITLDFLADYAHVNKYYLVHAFNKEYGITPINYLIDRRIRESQHLLSTTSMSLADIAQQLGFSSPSYFSQSFRRLAGISPMQYRKEQRAQD